MRCLLLFLCIAVSAFADKLKLNNGTTVEGNIVGETTTEYIVERSLAGGTIKTKDTIRKSDVAEVIRTTAKEKTAAAMKEAYEATKRYQLNPNSSFAKDYYNQVLSGSFRKFLAEYSDSPFAAEMRERIADWESERDKVVSGKVKVGGRWLDAAEAGLQQAVAQAQSYGAQGKFQEAIQLLQPFRTAKQPAIAREAARQEQQLYDAWQNYLETRLKSITTETQTWQKRLQDASASAARARQDLEQWKTTHQEGTAGYKGFLAQHEGAIQQAEVEEKTCNVRLAQLREETTFVQQKLGALQSYAAEHSVQLPAPPPPPPPPSPRTAEADIVDKITTWVKEHWWYSLVGLAVLWWILRKL